MANGTDGGYETAGTTTKTKNQLSGGPLLIGGGMRVTLVYADALLRYLLTLRIPAVNSRSKSLIPCCSS